MARLDGRAFHTLTKELGVEKPFDTGFRDAMVNAAKHLMQSGFNTVYSFVQSDEISVLFDAEDATFSWRYSKLISILAGEASAAFSLGLGTPATFDCRLLELGDLSEVHDYFTWRQRDAERNCRTRTPTGPCARGASGHEPRPGSSAVFRVIKRRHGC